MHTTSNTFEILQKKDFAHQFTDLKFRTVAQNPIYDAFDLENTEKNTQDYRKSVGNSILLGSFGDGDWTSSIRSAHSQRQKRRKERERERERERNEFPIRSPLYTYLSIIRSIFLESKTVWERCTSAFGVIGLLHTYSMQCRAVAVGFRILSILPETRFLASSSIVFYVHTCNMNF